MIPVQCPACCGYGEDAYEVPCATCDGKGYHPSLRWPNWETALFLAFGIFVGVAVALQV